MTIKLTYQQAHDLRHLFEALVLEDQPQTMEEKLIAVMIIQVYKKLRAKLEAKLKGKTGYSLPLTDAEAYGFFCYFFGRDFGLDWQREQLIIQTHLNEIDRQHG